MFYTRGAQPTPEQVFARSPVFRRLRNFPHVSDMRCQELDVWVYEQFLTLPRMDKLRGYLESHVGRNVAMAVLDMIRMAAGWEPPGHFSEVVLMMRGRLLDDWGIPSEALLAAMLSCGMVEHVQGGLCAFSAPEMVTFPKERMTHTVDAQYLVDTIRQGPYMAAHPVECSRTLPGLRLGMREPATGSLAAAGL